MEIKDGNIVIAKWLGWEYYEDTWDVPYDLENRYLLPTNEQLKFHSDSNWQWLCLEKIAKENNCDILDSIKLTYFWNKGINSKQDLFEAIVNYIKNKEMETKEVLQGKIDILQLVSNKYGSKDQFDIDIEKLEQQLEQAKSIDEYIAEQVMPIIIENQGLKLYKDNEINRLREVFEASREFLGDSYVYDNFDNYLKMKENGTTNSK